MMNRFVTDREHENMKLQKKRNRQMLPILFTSVFCTVVVVGSVLIHQDGLIFLTFIFYVPVFIYYLYNAYKAIYTDKDYVDIFFMSMIMYFFALAAFLSPLIVFISNYLKLLSSN